MRRNRPRLLPILFGSMLVSAVLAPGASQAANPSENGAKAPPGIWGGAHVPAGGMIPPGAVLHNPEQGNTTAAKNGETLFTAMHCIGCHAAGGAGSVGPSLADGRWIFGGSDSAVFQSVFYGRPNGMPAFGGVLGEKGVWDIVTYIRTLTPPPDLATESWEPQSEQQATEAPKKSAKTH